MARDAKRGGDLLVAGVARARALVQGDPINLDLRETLVERLYRDARLYPIGGGTREIMNEVIGKTEGY